MPIHQIPGAVYPDEYNFDAEWSQVLNGTTGARFPGRDPEMHVDLAKKMGVSKIAGLALAYQDLKKRVAVLEAAHERQSITIRELRAGVEA